MDRLIRESNKIISEEINVSRQSIDFLRNLPLCIIPYSAASVSMFVTFVHVTKRVITDIRSVIMWQRNGPSSVRNASTADLILDTEYFYTAKNK